MGTTANYGWSYPELTDEPNVPLYVKTLADAADADLKALSTAVAALGGDVDDPESPVPVVGGTWRATGSAQSIPATASGPGTPVALGTPVGSPSGVTTATSGDGHVFTLGSAGLWVGGFIGRWLTTTVGGVRDFGVYCDRAGGTNYAEALSSPNPQTVTGQPKGGAYSFARYLPSGTKIIVYAYNGTGSPRSLEPNGGQWCALDIWRAG
jgi:hypothetical protein